MEELIPEDRVRTHLGPDPNDASHELLIPPLLRASIRIIEPFIYVIEIGVHFLQPAPRTKVCKLEMGPLFMGA